MGRSCEAASRTMRPGWRADCRNECPSLRLQPLRGPAPQRVAMLAPEEPEMTELWHGELGGPDGQNLRARAGIALAQHLNGRPRRPGIVGEAERAHRAPVIGKIL